MEKFVKFIPKRNEPRFFKIYAENSPYIPEKRIALFC